MTTPTTSFSISGLHRLDEEQTELLQSLGLDVPEVQTTAQLQDLLQRADAEVAKMSNSFAQSMSRDMLAELRVLQGL